MFDTTVVIVGNVLSTPEWRRTNNSGSLVANFRIASTARRFDRETGRWVDGNSLRVRVTAWRRLAEGVASSITVGDPVIVFGRLYTRDWQDENGNNRIAYEMEAMAIGHDLARGRGKFFRTKTVPATSTVEDAEAEAFVGGEMSAPLAVGEEPIAYGDGLPERLPGEEPPTFLDAVAVPPRAEDDDAEPTVTGGPASDGELGDEFVREMERATRTAAPAGGSRRVRRSAAKREPVPA